MQAPRLAVKTLEGPPGVPASELVPGLWGPKAVLLMTPRHPADPKLFNAIADKLCSTSHPNLLQALGVRSGQDGTGLVFESITGQSVADLLVAKDGPLSNHLVLRISSQICQALRHLHDKVGLLHGDLRADNVLLADPAMEVKLLMFGGPPEDTSSPTPPHPSPFLGRAHGSSSANSEQSSSLSPPPPPPNVTLSSTSSTSLTTGSVATTSKTSPSNRSTLSTPSVSSTGPPRRLSRLPSTRSNLSKASSRRSFLSTASSTSLSHIAPERAKAKGQGVASDVYSLGSLMYLMVVGTPPWHDVPFSQAVEHVLAGAKPPFPARCTAPDALKNLIHEALERDPDARITPEAMLTALSDIQLPLSDEFEAQLDEYKTPADFSRLVFTTRTMVSKLRALEEELAQEKAKTQAAEVLLRSESHIAEADSALARGLRRRLSQLPTGASAATSLAPLIPNPPSSISPPQDLSRRGSDSSKTDSSVSSDVDEYPPSTLVGVHSGLPWMTPEQLIASVTAASRSGDTGVAATARGPGHRRGSKSQAGGSRKGSRHLQPSSSVRSRRKGSGSLSAASSPKIAGKSRTDNGALNTTVSSVDAYRKLLTDQGASVVISNQPDIDIAAFVGAVLQSPSVTQITLASCSLGDADAVVLGNIISRAPQVKELWLFGNAIGDAGAKALANALQEKSANLRALYLTGNRIGDAGVTALAEAVKVNTSLRVLSVYQNLFTDSGARKLLKAIDGNRTLTELWLTNDNLSLAVLEEAADRAAVRL